MSRLDTHKDTVLYTALVNVSAGNAFKEKLSTDFLEYLGANAVREGFDGTLYLGVIGNAPHMDTAVTYLRYLTE